MIIYNWLAITHDGQQLTNSSRPLVRLASAVRDPDRFDRILFFPNDDRFPSITFPAAAGASIKRRQEWFRKFDDSGDLVRVQLIKYQAPGLNLVARIDLQTGIINMDPD